MKPAASKAPEAIDPRRNSELLFIANDSGTKTTGLYSRLRYGISRGPMLLLEKLRSNVVATADAPGVLPEVDSVLHGNAFIFSSLYARLHENFKGSSSRRSSRKMAPFTSFD